MKSRKRTGAGMPKKIILLLLSLSLACLFTLAGCGGSPISGCYVSTGLGIVSDGSIEYAGDDDVGKEVLTVNDDGTYTLEITGTYSGIYSTDKTTVVIDDREFDCYDFKESEEDENPNQFLIPKDGPEVIKGNDALYNMGGFIIYMKKQ